MNAVHYILIMPKLIPQLEDHITQKAESLFFQNGFDGVSMRKLAAELNIAVGTLYNYFPNKTMLFFSIMDKSWNRTFSEIEQFLTSTGDMTHESRRFVIEILYNGIKERGAFTLKILAPAKDMQQAPKLQSHDPDWQQRLINKLCETLLPLGSGFSGPDARRTVKTLLAAIRFFIFSSETDDEAGDIDFLLKIAELN